MFLFTYFSSKNVIIRTLKKIPNTPANQLKTNVLSKVTGKALPVKTPLRSPFSKREGVFYQISIQQKIRSGKNSRWKTLIKEDCFQDFFLETSDGFVIVKP